MAMNMAMDRAEVYGIGTITAINGRHFGACAYHAAMALERDMIGIAMTTGGVNVAPVHGAERLVGLNPLGIAAPTRDETAFYIRRIDEQRRREQNRARKDALACLC